MFEDLKERIYNCHKCQIRKLCLDKPVPGVGNLNAKIFFCGMNPGRDELILGEPFVGLSGQLLTKLINEAGLDREDVYIGNVARCGTPKNREPDKTEIDNCKRYLWEEIQLVNPKVIVPLGKVPICLLLKKKNIKVFDYIGKFFDVDYTKAKIAPWLHPSFQIRNSKKYDQQAVAWFKQIKQFAETQ